MSIWDANDNNAGNNLFSIPLAKTAAKIEPHIFLCCERVVVTRAILIVER